jgi:rubrerythrin
MREELLQVKSYVNFRATEEDVLGYGYYCGACGRWSDRPANNVRCPNCGDEDEPPDPDLPLIGRCSTCGYSDDMEFICPLCGTAPLVKINPS